jgi:hypothetical protein
MQACSGFAFLQLSSTLYILTPHAAKHAMDFPFYKHALSVLFPTCRHAVDSSSSTQILQYSFPTYRHAGDFAFLQARNMPHFPTSRHAGASPSNKHAVPPLPTCRHAGDFAFQQESKAPFTHEQAYRGLRLPTRTQCPLSQHAGMQGTSPSNKNAVPHFPTCRHALDFAFQQECSAPFPPNAGMQWIRRSTSTQCILRWICLSTQCVLFSQRQARSSAFLQERSDCPPPPPYRAGTLFNPLFPVRARE